jgi:hypothetical protein
MGYLSSSLSDRVDSLPREGDIIVIVPDEAVAARDIIIIIASVSGRGTNPNGSAGREARTVEL